MEVFALHMWLSLPLWSESEGWELFHVRTTTTIVLGSHIRFKIRQLSQALFCSDASQPHVMFLFRELRCEKALRWANLFCSPVLPFVVQHWACHWISWFQFCIVKWRVEYCRMLDYACFMGAIDRQYIWSWFLNCKVDLKWGVCYCHWHCFRA